MPVPPPGPPPDAPSSRKSTAQGKRAGGSSCSVRSSAASQTPSMADPADYYGVYSWERTFFSEVKEGDFLAESDCI